jgi:UPF0271 protein
MMAIDLNADLGEGFGRWTLEDEAALMESVSSCNIACGFHAGDPGIMRRCVRLAREKGVAIGAHPGLPDLAGFGRRTMGVTPREVEDLVLYQVGALAAMARAEGAAVQHVKPHGALHAMAVADVAIAGGVVNAVRAFGARLLLFAPPGSALSRAAEAAGVPVVAEGFADREYDGDGRLAPRSRPGAVIVDVPLVVHRAVRMAREGVVVASGGETIPMAVGTICTHGDTPGAAEIVRLVRDGLERAGVAVRPPGE